MTAANDVVVLDNGGTSVRISYIRNGIHCSNHETFSTRRLCVPEAATELLNIITGCVQRHGLNIKAVVLGIPGVLDRDNDQISHCNNIPQLEGTGLKHFLSSGLGCKVLLEQDIMLQLLGEWRAGSGQSSTSLFGVYFGTGIGAAYLLNGDPGNAQVQDLQVGHIPIMAEGRRCQCGNTDCIEAYACGHTLIDLASRSGCPVEHLFKRRHEPHWSINLSAELDNFIRFQAYMLATVCTLFKPDCVIIGGGIPKMADYPRHTLLQTAREHLQKPDPAQSAKFEWASLGDQAPLHGALALMDIEQKNQERERLAEHPQ